MFTREFTTGAGTFESDIDNIYLSLIRLAAASLAFAPERFFVDAFTYPFCRIGKIFPGFFGRFIGSKRKYLIFGQVQSKNIYRENKSKLITI